jgi:hypothetical protein
VYCTYENDVAWIYGYQCEKTALISDKTSVSNYVLGCGFRFSLNNNLTYYLHDSDNVHLLITNLAFSNLAL